MPQSRRKRPSKTRNQRSRGRNRTVSAKCLPRYPAPFRQNLQTSITVVLTNNLPLTTDGSGVIQAIVPCNPNATTGSNLGAVSLFPEWASWATLFGAIKCIQLEITVMNTTLDETKGDVVGLLHFGGNLQTATAPSSVSVLEDNIDYQNWNILMDTSGTGRYHALRHKQLAWAASSSPIPTGTIGAGCPGGIGLYASALPLSTTVGNVRVRGIYKLKSRT